jgi:uncharacterized protein DUF6894
MGAVMPQYYFHVEDDKRWLDDLGQELPDIAAARTEALRVSGELLKDSPTVGLWHGTPWRLWVTDKPEGEGTTFFTLRFSAETQAA